jgi:hypothetical protein
VGRIGRASISKWHPRSEEVVDRLLAARPGIRWLSVGMPDSLGVGRLHERWGSRFTNLSETSDPDLLAEVTQSLDLQVFFSRHGECFASSIAEAAGLGVPTIALSTPFNDNGQAEQVTDGVTGYLVAGLDQATDVVGQLHDRPAELQALKTRTAAYAHKRWHYRRVASDLTELYRFWRSNDMQHSPLAYVQTMMTEERDFAQSYKGRLLRLAAKGGPSQLALRIGLPAYETWSIFKATRTLKAFAGRAVAATHAI